MNLSTNQSFLSAGLAITSRAIASRTTMPVLSNVLLDTTGDTLRLAATNREIGINVWIGAKVEDDGAVTVPAKLLSEFVSALPDDTVSMDLKQKTLTLHLSCARYTANMKGIAHDEFPLLPTTVDEQFANVQPVSLEPDALRTMIDRVTFAASTDENRPTLTGVEVSMDINGLKMAATDGFRLSVARLDVDGQIDELSAIIPARALDVVAFILDKDAGGVDVYMVRKNGRSERVLFVFTGNDKAKWQRVELSSELIDARYPDYNATIMLPCRRMRPPWLWWTANGCSKLSALPCCMPRMRLILFVSQSAIMESWLPVKMQNQATASVNSNARLQAKGSILR